MWYAIYQHVRRVYLCTRAIRSQNRSYSFRIAKLHGSHAFKEHLNLRESLPPRSMNLKRAPPC
ncbi:hypothetical protein SAMN04488061_1275 [Filomicrobium insigne]|uniref:Uncharacterized protein n=1 Tax=Filomicrobium insigne TaxID=418854 RepID=A0A1H0L6B8_9HYPH|nr:hypothetical protein SAMN04488061_1275 [Filomicrobium insigne]